MTQSDHDKLQAAVVMAALDIIQAAVALGVPKERICAIADPAFSYLVDEIKGLVEKEGE